MTHRFRADLPPAHGLCEVHSSQVKLGGVTVIHGKALGAGQQPVTLTAIPNYAWANRKKGAMTVWINAG